MLKDKVVTTTRHLTNIETIDGAANEQIQRALHDDRGKAPKHLHKTVNSEHSVAKESDKQTKEFLPSGPSRSQRKMEEVEETSRG